MIQSYRDLQVSQRSVELWVPIHQLLLKYPSYERYELCGQMRRSSKSIPANIAEGYTKRRFEKEFRLHLNIAMGEANEMVVHIEISRALNYLDEPTRLDLVD